MIWRRNDLPCEKHPVFWCFPLCIYYVITWKKHNVGLVYGPEVDSRPLASILLEGYKVIRLWGDNATGEAKRIPESVFDLWIVTCQIVG
jgi:hypothetical protein